MSLGSCVGMAVLITRTLLPPSVRFLAKHASAELFQLTIIAFCLVSGLISGYMVHCSLLSMSCIASWGGVQCPLVAGQYGMAAPVLLSGRRR